MTTEAPPQPAFSPSIVHRRLMLEEKPALRYDGGDVAAWQAKLRAKFSELLGYDRMPPEKCPLNPRTIWRREHELGSIEKLVFTAEEGADVPAYLCLPKAGKAPYPTFICLQGHTTGMHNSIAVSADESEPIEAKGDRDFALGCMKHGFAALCIEQRAFGERRETEIEARGAAHISCHEASMHALMLGRTLSAERAYDVDRGIDYLATRDEIDLSRLGVMGNSGGGTTSVHTGALLDRIRFMMPSCYFCTYRDSIMNVSHCLDNYTPGLLLYAEMADVLGLFAPRPVVVVAGKEDPIFPIHGVYEAFEDLKRIYAAAGAPDNCKLVVGPEGHRFYADAAWPVMLEYV